MDEISAVCEEASQYAVGGKALKPYFDGIKAEADDFEYDNAAEKAALLKKRFEE